MVSDSRPRINTKFLDSASSSSDAPSIKAKTNKSTESTRAAEIKKKISNKQNELRSKQVDISASASNEKATKKILSSDKKLIKESGVLPQKLNALNRMSQISPTEKIHDKEKQLPEFVTSNKNSNIQDKDVQEISDSNEVLENSSFKSFESSAEHLSDEILEKNRNSSINEESMKSNANADCKSVACNLRFIKLEDTVNNLTKLLDQQLRIVDQQRIEIQTYMKILKI
ncbi:uncharacterized protein LOC122501119 [Leptopilina heterotoma]|uniref:uncharacterized protein LOC122501119 n=1 Tax=Leptopilina heterotoma TaxID=63436 RepID=UPI001CA9CF12|nr:uncharacterized protein LOC122501119 [Leptopilina heterotoma]